MIAELERKETFLLRLFEHGRLYSDYGRQCSLVLLLHERYGQRVPWRPCNTFLLLL